MATASDVPLLQGADDPKRITISMGSAGDACGVWIWQFVRELDRP